MDLKDIKAIIDLMRKNAVSEFEMEKEGFRLRLKRGPASGEETVGGMVPSLPAVPTPMPLPVAPTAARPSAGPTPPPEPEFPEIEIKSPMIGTFYRAPSPESAPYVEVGSEVHPDTVVCIIEAMKVMNEIKAEVRGIITQVLVENAKPVEFGQPLFKVRPLPAPGS